MKIMINKTKAILSGAVLLFTGGFGLYYLIRSMYPEAPAFLAIAALFLYLFYKNAAFITVTEEFIQFSFLGIKKKRILWSEVKELGLIGENVFSKKKNNTGDKYIYFSPVQMTSNQRFQMIVKWPPKNMLYMQYSEKALEHTLAIWGKDLKTYHVEDLFPNTED